jgi:hypothetical protein
MPLNLQGFVTEPNQWAGLYQAANQLEKRQARADQLALQQQTKRNAAGTFLQNYLDPKDYLSGTQFDPLILQGLQEAKQQGARLVASGADSPTLMMALGPMVNKLTKYTTNAKNINKQVDEQIKLMKDSGEIGYDFKNLRDEALRLAFYKQDANGQMQLDPDQADQSVDWVNTAIELSPEKVTNGAGFDTYADKAKMKNESLTTQDFDRFGNMDKHKLNVKFQEYMVPEYSTDPKTGSKKLIGFVPKYDNVFEGGTNPLMHTFTDPTGKQTKAQVRVLDEDFYDGLPKGLRNNIRGQVKQHLSEYELATGEKIPANSSKAKWVERALAYNELNRPSRNYGDKGELIVENKPSSQMVNLNVKSLPEYKQMVEDVAYAQTTGHNRAKPPKSNFIEAFGAIYNNDPEYTQGPTGTPLGGSKEMLDITGVFPKGGLRSGIGQGYNYKKIFFDPDERSIVLERETKQDMFGRKHQSTETIPESEFGKFIHRVAEANGVSQTKIKEMLKAIGYEGTQFKSTKATQAQRDFDKIDKQVQSWRSLTTQPLGLPFNSGKQ